MGRLVYESACFLAVLETCIHSLLVENLEFSRWRRKNVGGCSVKTLSSGNYLVESQGASRVGVA
jgi:hypothetical protein